jgi:hypothetical protein
MRTLLAAMLLSVSAHAALAQNTPSAAPRVKCIRNLAPKDDTEKNCSAMVTARLEDSISVDVTGYAEWARDGDNKSKLLHLFIEGIELENLTLRYVGRNQDNTDAFWTRLKFGTDDTTDAKVQENRELWSQVLRTARRSDTLALSIGPHGGGQWPTDARIHINSHPTGLSIFAGVVIAALVAGLIAAGIRTSLLRDANGAARPPYSLAKHQMAVWFVVIVSSFLFVMMTTGAAAATSSTALMLIGISGGTGLVAVVMDKNKRSTAVDERQKLVAERDAIAQALDTPDTGLRAQLAKAAPASAEAVQLAAAIQSKVERLNVVTTQLVQQPNPPAQSESWWRDLLSDENGISFHRLQIAVWTVVLVGAFVTAVWRTFAMPEFDNVTLGLLGISSGTYLGFKFPEKQS